MDVMSLHGHNKVRRLAIGMSTNSLPTDMRKYNGKQPTTKSSSVDGFMTYVYWNLVPHPKEYTFDNKPHVVFGSQRANLVFSI